MEPEKHAVGPPERMGVREFRANFAGFMRRVRNGASYIVTSRAEVVAVIQPPPAPARPRRQAGGLRGRIWMAPDFDALQDEVLAGMEGEEG